MNVTPIAVAEDPQEEIAVLVLQLQATQQRLQELTGGEVDAVTIPGGHSYLLQEAQGKLQRNERALRLRERALGEISQGVLFTDARRRIVYANTGFQKISGYSEAELLGKNCSILQGPLTDLETMEKMRATLDAGQPFESEILNYRKDGTPFWNDLSIAPVPSESGEPGRFIGIQRDITERKEAENALRKSEEQFRQASGQLAKVLDSSLDAICTFDVEGRFAQVSAACETIWGYRPAELLGQVYLDFVFPEDRPMTVQAASEIMAGNPTVNFENRYVRKDGSLAHISWSAMWSEADQSMFCVARDNTEVRQREMESRELTERLKLAVKASKVGIWDWDIVGGTVHWDEQMYELYGESSEAGLASFELWQRRLHPDDKERTNAEVAEALRPNGRPFEISFRIVVPPNEEIRHIRGEGIVFRDPAGQAIRVLGTNWDVTRQVLREDALRRKLENEEALRREASAGEKAKSEFLAVMSHEIRTPMNGILGFAEMLTHDTTLSEESSGYVETIRSSGNALLHILDDVLDFSRIEAGRLKIEKVAVSLSLLIDEITVLFALQIREKGLDFQSSVAGDVPPLVMGDPGRIRQILVNLVGNAVKFTVRGKIRLGVQRSNARLEFFVHDTGSGIAAGKIEEIFEPFAQADSSTARCHGGAGLGLTISRRLAGLMGGELKARSHSGQGAEFSLLLPLELHEAAGAINPSKPSRDALLPSLTVLFAEDDPVNQKLIGLMLRKFGYEPLMARNGVEAVRLYQENLPDCILMDVQMPEMDGIEATRQIRELEQASHSPRAFIAALTANILPEDRARCFEVGMDSYLNKPVKSQEIAAVLAKAGRLRGKVAGK